MRASFLPSCATKDMLSWSLTIPAASLIYCEPFTATPAGTAINLSILHGRLRVCPALFLLDGGMGMQTLGFALLVSIGIVIYLFAGRMTKRHYQFNTGEPDAVFAKSSHIVTPTESYKIHERLQMPVPDYSNFELLEDRRVIDLRDWKAFEKGALGRVSPVTWSRLIKLRKTKPADWIRFAFATEGAGIDAECSSGQDYYLETGTIASTPPQLLMKTFHVVVNVAKYEVGEQFELELQATLWNGSAEQEDWTAYKVYAPVNVCSILILFSEKKPFLWKKIVMYKPESLQELVPPAEQGSLIYDPNRRVLYWEIKNPTLDNTYEIQWGW